jgi:hypothetical protein
MFSSRSCQHGSILFLCGFGVPSAGHLAAAGTGGHDGRVPLEQPTSTRRSGYPVEPVQYNFNVRSRRGLRFR